MNSELPKVDITYGTKRHGERVYKSALTFFYHAIKKHHFTFEITTTDGSEIIANLMKTNTKAKLAVFSNCRLRLSEIACSKTRPFTMIPFVNSVVSLKESTESRSHKTFHLILNKAHAKNQKVAVFMKNGKIVKGYSENCDFDSVTLSDSGHFTLVMYDAVKRIVPLEPDGSIAE